ncbi:hypothetical protein BD413DRAFT_278364 [Trametes elegans]|nr:hypothetical protein BD413DRAFT_278364 [Trametes elegans]
MKLQKSYRERMSSYRAYMMIVERFSGYAALRKHVVGSVCLGTPTRYAIQRPDLLVIPKPTIPARIVPSRLPNAYPIMCGTREAHPRAWRVGCTRQSVRAAQTSADIMNCDRERCVIASGPVSNSVAPHTPGMAGRLGALERPCRTDARCRSYLGRRECKVMQ